MEGLNFIWRLLSCLRLEILQTAFCFLQFETANGLNFYGLRSLYCDDCRGRESLYCRNCSFASQRNNAWTSFHTCGNSPFASKYNCGGALGWHRCICTICVWRNTVVVFCIFIGGKAQEYCYGGVNLYVKKQAATACFFSTHRTYMNVFQCVLHDTSLYLLF